MDKNGIAKRNNEWAESKTILVVGVFMTWAITDNVYDTLVKGCPMYFIFVYGKGIFWDVVSLLLFGCLIFASLASIHNHNRKETRLKPVSLWIHAFWSGTMVLDLFVLIAFYLDFFLTNVSRF
jgi:hypothetical protein